MTDLHSIFDRETLEALHEFSLNTRTGVLTLRGENEYEVHIRLSHDPVPADSLLRSTRLLVDVHSAWSGLEFVPDQINDYTRVWRLNS